jgi:hypothetical protein
MPSPEETVLTTPPDLVVLESLKQTCAMTRRHNPDPAVAKVALRWEAKFLADMEKLQREAAEEREAA